MTAQAERPYYLPEAPTAPLPRTAGPPPSPRLLVPPPAPARIGGRHRRDAIVPAPRPAAEIPVARAETRLGLLTVICLGVMGIVMADITALAIAMPALAADPIAAGLPAGDLQWAHTVFLIADGALITVTGRAADVIGARRLLIAGLLLFTVGALLGFTALTWPMLLAGRLAAGVGTALMLPPSLGMLLAALPAVRRPGAVARWSGAAGAGAALLFLGAAFLDGMSWRLLLLPSAVVGTVLLCCAFALPPGRRQRGRLPDVLGALLVMAGGGALITAISHGPSWGWRSTPTLACVAGSVLALLVAVLRSRRHPVPALDLSLWSRPGWLSGWVLTGMYGVLMFPLLIMLPQAMTLTGPAGLAVMAALPGLGIVGSILAKHVSRAGWGWPVLLSAALIVAVLPGLYGARQGDPPIWIPLAIVATLALLAGACTRQAAIVLLAGMAALIAAVLANPLATPWAPLLFSGALGLALGLLSAGSSARAISAAGPSRSATAIGTATTARMGGGAIGVAAITALSAHPPLPGPYGGLAAELSLLIGAAALCGLAAMSLPALSAQNGSPS